MIIFRNNRDRRIHPIERLDLVLEVVGGDLTFTIPLEHDIPRTYNKVQGSGIRQRVFGGALQQKSESTRGGTVYAAITVNKGHGLASKASIDFGSHNLIQYARQVIPNLIARAPN
jgi:hypothetical protein